MIKNVYLIIAICVLISSCELFERQDGGTPVARVNNLFLYESSLKNLGLDNVSEADSAIIVNNFINKWASQQLLLSKAKINLTESKQKEFGSLVEQYKTDLFTKAYQEALVNQSMDTTVSLNQALEVYQSNREIFKLNEDLLKLRYLNINENSINLEDIRKRFKRFNDEDKRILDSISIQFKSYTLNDSMWIRYDRVIEKIRILGNQNKQELLKKPNFIELKDSLGLYLMQITDVLLRNQLAPIEYVMPTIRQIVINKRKLEFIKQLEKDITKDAIKNKQFEIFN